MERPMPLPTERTALLVAASSMPSRRAPRGPVLPKSIELMVLPMPVSACAAAPGRGTALPVAPGKVATRARSFSAALSRFTGVS